MKKIVIATREAPGAIGPYSQAVMVESPDCFLFASGQIPINPETGELVTGSPAAQTRQVMLNLKAVLAAADMSVKDVVKTTIFLKDLAHFGEVNAVYAEMMEENLPARATVEVARLPKDVQVEIEVVAAK